MMPLPSEQAEPVPRQPAALEILGVEWQLIRFNVTQGPGQSPLAPGLLDAIRREDCELEKVAPFADRPFEHRDGRSTDRVVDLVLGR